MSRHAYWFVVASAAVVTLAGCGRGFFNYGEREPWRREAEIACLNSGTVKEGPGIVRISPIDGPGMCGAEYPLKVTAFIEGAAIGYGDEAIRPPGSVPGGGGPASQVRWPITQQPYPPPQPGRASPSPGAPMSIEAPGVSQQNYPPEQQLGAPPAYLRAPPEWQRANGQPGYAAPPRPAPVSRDDEAAPYTRPAPAPPPVIQSQPIQSQPVQPLPPLGPPRPQQVAALMPVEVKPAATLACPIVSALDRWIATAVQPAAQKWFGQQVAEIKQISAYSCRGMNGDSNAHISEHAFGNALDIAAFVVADGHRITVKDGWRGSAEEQGFLRDVQGAACDQFTTVLAPGSNRFHYDHIHVDLSRRSSGRRICNPGAVDGEVVAARIRKHPVYASRPYEAPPTRNYDPPVEPGSDPFAWRGDRRDPATTGSIAARRPGGKDPASEDGDWVEDPGPRPKIDWTATSRHKVY